MWITQKYLLLLLRNREVITCYLTFKIACNNFLDFLDNFLELSYDLMAFLQLLNWMNFVVNLIIIIIFKQSSSNNYF